jgi:hypothetical protein
MSNHTTDAVALACRLVGIADAAAPEALSRAATETASSLTSDQRATCATWKIATGLFAEALRRVSLNEAERSQALRSGLGADAMHEAKALRLARQVDQIARANARAAARGGR